MSPRAVGAFALFFALSGFTGLIYESIWTQFLKLFLGHAAYAQTLVLATFMGGLALGALLCSRLSGRWHNLLKGYCLAETAIGLFALGFHPIFKAWLAFAYSSVLPFLGSPTAVTLFKWVYSCLLILPPTILLGMTFPLMAGGIFRLAPRFPGRLVALLYCCNAMGGAFGIVASGFFGIKYLGLPGTIQAAGG